MARFTLRCGDADVPVELVREGRHLWFVQFEGGVRAWVAPHELTPVSPDAIVPHFTRAEVRQIDRGRACDPTSYEVAS